MEIMSDLQTRNLIINAKEVEVSKFDIFRILADGTHIYSCELDDVVMYIYETDYGYVDYTDAEIYISGELHSNLIEDKHPNFKEKIIKIVRNIDSYDDYKLEYLISYLESFDSIDEQSQKRIDFIKSELEKRIK
jgi:hypothetical protein